MTHSRHDCVQFPFTPGGRYPANRNSCDKCFCFMCEVPVGQWLQWGDHCHMSNKGEGLALLKAARSRAAETAAAVAQETREKQRAPKELGVVRELTFLEQAREAAAMAVAAAAATTAAAAAAAKDASAAAAAELMAARVKGERAIAQEDARQQEATEAARLQREHESKLELADQEARQALRRAEA